MNKVCAVIVTYNTLLPDLIKVLESLYFQVEKIILVNNDANQYSPHLTGFANIEEHVLGSNFGIGYAQNYGIKITLTYNFDFVLLSDQDTVYPEDYTRKMLTGFDTDSNVGAIAPGFIDLNVNNTKPSFVFSRGSWFVTKEVNSGTYDIFHAIASGLIIKVDVFKKVGFMNEELFIDWVDLEWCWRLRKSGLRLIGNASVLIRHVLGDRSLNIGFRKVPIRNHVRHYYITRNAFYLSIYTSTLSRMQKFSLAIRSLKYLIGFPLLSNDKFLNFLYVFRGFVHGVVGRLGKLD